MCPTRPLARFGEQEHLEQQLNPGVAADWPWGGCGDTLGTFLGTPRGSPRVILHPQRAISRKKSGSEHPSPPLPPPGGDIGDIPGDIRGDIRGDSTEGSPLPRTPRAVPVLGRWVGSDPTPHPPRKKSQVPSAEEPLPAPARSAGKFGNCHRVSPCATGGTGGGRGSCSPSAKRCLISAN